MYICMDGNLEDVWKCIISSSSCGSASERRRTESWHRRGSKTVPAQTAEITNFHVIFIVSFKFLIEIAGGDGINQFLLKNCAFWCIICSEQKGHQIFFEGKPWHYCDVIIWHSSFQFFLLWIKLWHTLQTYADSPYLYLRLCSEGNYFYYLV
jgi:hypothetical protein